MALQGQFKLVLSQRYRVKEWSFTLKNTNLFQSETFDCALIDCFGQNPWFFRNQKLKAGETMTFNHDTVPNFTYFKGWCQGDRFAIVDSKNRIKKEWKLQIPVYAPGECPDCHGTKKCRHCGGAGVFMDSKTHKHTTCSSCAGTGICHTCDIPMRKQPPMGGGILPGGPKF